jgi:signal transduction histidine kinase
VFLVRSIRRTLVLLFAIALVLMGGLASIGAVSLFWHQEAVENLDFLLHRSPDRDELSRSVARISESVHENYDLTREDSVEELRRVFGTEVGHAIVELSEFRKRINSLAPSTNQPLQQRQQVDFRLQNAYDELRAMQRLSVEFHTIRSTEQQMAMDARRFRIGLAVSKVQKSLEKLPAYEAGFGEEKLATERSRASMLFSALLWTAGIVAVIFITILTCGLKWISGPVREIARGCTRIANGDTGFRLQPVCRWQGEFSDVVASVNCMADRFQQAEEDLQHKVEERSEQLFRSQRLANVGFLAAGVAHEINNPLSAISMAAESLEFRLFDMLDSKDTESQLLLDRIAMIRRESRRCGDITARLLNFARGERAGKLNVDIAELIREVLVMVNHMGRYSDRHVRVDAPRPVFAEVDPAQLKQVILNLVANALQATESDGEVTISLQEQVDNFLLVVSDNGCGMNKETLEHIFDPFFTTQETGQGTGLGLCITHRIIQDHGGTVTPTSEGIGKGSSFRIRIPRRQLRSYAA